MQSIAFIPGKFRAPHKGHCEMIEWYAKSWDYVIVVVANPKDQTLRPKVSKQILDLYIKKLGLKNVKVVISKEVSPVKEILIYLSTLKDSTVTLGRSDKGGKDKYDWFYDFASVGDKNLKFSDYSKDGFDPKTNISSSDLFEHINDKAYLKANLPSFLSDSDLNSIISMLNQIQTEALKPIDETECIHCNITDEMLYNSKLLVYNVGQVVRDDSGKDVPVNPKKFPQKAIDIVVPLIGAPDELCKNCQAEVEIFLDTETKKWDSEVRLLNANYGKLSLEQFGQFFNSEFYQHLEKILEKKWPLSDELYGGLFAGVANRTMKVSLGEPMTEDSNDHSKREDLAGKDVDRDHEPDYTNSGRKIVHFSDFGVKRSSGKYYCWPKQGHEFTWAQWKDWKKIKPLCRISFKHGDHTYGVSISTFSENYENRGFRGYDLNIRPPLAWITPEECTDVMDLTIFKKFAKHCVERIEHYLGMETEDIYKKINRLDKISKEEIDETKRIIAKVLKSAIKERKADTFSFKK